MHKALDCRLGVGVPKLLTIKVQLSTLQEDAFSGARALLLPRTAVALHPLNLLIV